MGEGGGEKYVFNLQSRTTTKMLHVNFGEMLLATKHIVNPVFKVSTLYRMYYGTKKRLYVLCLGPYMKNNPNNDRKL